MSPALRTLLSRLLCTALLVVLIFPRFDLVSGVGVDNSLAWAFNHLFATGLEQGAHLVFPHGPLAFLMYPQALGGDLDAAFIGITLILGTFIFALLSLGSQSDASQPVRNMLVAATLGCLLQIHLQLVGITAVALVLHWRTGGRGWLATAALAALIALHVRAGVGIMAGTLLATHGILLVWRRRQWRSMAITTLSFVVAAVLLRLVLFGNLTGIGTYYMGLYELTRASSAATGLYPHNLWWAVIPGLVLFLSIPLWVRDASLRHLYALFALALFAAWKHGVTREDVEHARGILIFLLLFLGILVLVWERPRILPMAAFALVLVLAQIALTATLYYKPYVLTPFGADRAYQWAFRRATLKHDAIIASERELSTQVLPLPLLEILDQGTVDVYPWEYSFIPANRLRWKPRPVLQTYASYTPWLDARNAEHFTLGRGADRILWHFEPDAWGGRMGSIDGRYLLNDEPRTILALLDRYTWSSTTQRIAILERHAGECLGPTRVVGDTIGGWDVWNPVPGFPDGILRARVDVRGTLRRTAKDLVYKDALYTVTYRLDDGTTRTYRFVPDLAAEGLWLAPFVQHPNGTIDAPRVTHLRFHCSTPGMVQAQLPILWEHTPLLPRSGITPPAYSLFGPQRTPATLLGRHSFDMGSPDPSWQFHSHQSTDSMAHSGAHANLLRPGSYSATYVQALDTFTAPVNVQASAWIRSAPDNTLAFAISVEDNTGILFWEAVDANDQLFDEREWWRVAVQRTVQPGAGRLLKVYIYNDGTRAALVDDMEVRLSHDTAPVTGGS